MGMRRVFGLMVSLALFSSIGPAIADDADVVPLPRAHAHNDYNHKRPLLDALDNGFCSVEADFYLVDGKLLVAHDLDKTKPERTLQRLYLDPLRERVKANGGRVYPGGPTVTLLLDIKSNGPKTYAALHEVLSQYADIMTAFEGETIKEGAVTAIVSGNCPRNVMAEQPLRYAAVDGRPRDLDSDAPVSLIPLISESWSSLFDWRGAGEMPADQRAKLDEFVRKAHEKGRRIRFWGLPWGKNIWPLVYEAGVDLINADNLPGLRGFLLEQGAQQGAK